MIFIETNLYIELREKNFFFQFIKHLCKKGFSFKDIRLFFLFLLSKAMNFLEMNCFYYYFFIKCYYFGIDFFLEINCNVKKFNCHIS